MNVLKSSHTWRHDNISSNVPKIVATEVSPCLPLLLTRYCLLIMPQKSENC